MLKKAPDIVGVIVGIGVRPASVEFFLIRRVIEEYVRLKTENGKARLSYIYREVAEERGYTVSSVKTIVNKGLTKAFKKTHYKFLYEYFDLETEFDDKITVAELCDLIILIQEDRRKYLENLEKTSC